jgi:alpha-glucosidase
MPWDAGEAPNGFTTGTPWLPVKPCNSLLNVADQHSDPQSTLAFYRQILHWRKDHPVLATGDIRFLEAGEPILAYTRTRGNTTVLCVFNLSGGDQAFPLPDEIGPNLDPISQGATLKADMLELAPNGFAFLVA